jgi:hypothetical protein
MVSPWHRFCRKVTIHTIHELAAQALLYNLLVWAVAAGITVCIYLGVSLADFAELVRTAIRVSAAAMWLVPATLLVSMRSAAATAFGLALIANSVRLLLSGGTPQQSSRRRRKRHWAVGEMFHSACLQPPKFGETFQPVAGAIALECGVCAACAGYPFSAAGFVIVWASIWTRLSKSRGATGVAGPKGWWSTLLTVLLSVMLTVALLLVPSGSLAAAPKPPPLPADTSVTPVFTPAKSVGNGVTGVILRAESPKPRPRRRLWGGPPIPAALQSLAQPLTIPFTGEYRLFRRSSRRLPADAITEKGTPLDSRYATTNGEPMHMEAYQAFSPAIELRNCGGIRMKIASRETLPGVVMIEFLTTNAVEEEAVAVFALNGAPEETISFTIRPRVVFVIDAIRVIFEHNPTDSEQNSRVAIESFTFTPEPGGAQHSSSTRPN